MSRDKLRTGRVIRFPDLRATPSARKRAVMRIARPKGEEVLLLFPVALPRRFAVDIPEKEERRAGLNASLRLWIGLDEYNRDVIGQSFYPEPGPRLGHLSKAFFCQS